MNGGMILCGLGFHDWREGSPAPFDNRDVQTCARCYEERPKRCPTCGAAVLKWERKR